MSTTVSTFPRWPANIVLTDLCAARKFSDPRQAGVTGLLPGVTGRGWGGGLSSCVRPATSAGGSRAGEQRPQGSPDPLRQPCVVASELKTSEEEAGAEAEASPRGNGSSSSAGSGFPREGADPGRLCCRSSPRRAGCSLGLKADQTRRAQRGPPCSACRGGARHRHSCAGLVPCGPMPVPLCSHLRLACTPLPSTFIPAPPTANRHYMQHLQNFKAPTRAPYPSFPICKTGKVMYPRPMPGTKYGKLPFLGC